MSAEQSIAEVLEGPDFEGKSVVSGSVSTTGSTAVGYVFGKGFVSGKTFDHQVIDGLPSTHQEQDPTVLQSAVASAFQSLCLEGGALNGVDVLALGFDAMEHTLSARLGSQLQSNLITWQDTRAVAYEGEFQKIFGCQPGFGLAGPKLLALSRDPGTKHLFENPQMRFDVLASLLNYWACGESFLGPSELRSQGWPVLASGADPNCLSMIHPNLPQQMPQYLPHDQFAPIGLTEAAARAWGLPAGIPVAGALGDNQATYALFPPGTVVVSGGTSGTAFCEAQGEVPAGTFGSAYDKPFLMKVQQNLGQVGDRIVDLFVNARYLNSIPTDSSRRGARNEIRRAFDATLLRNPGRFADATALGFLTGDRTPSIAEPLTLIRDFGSMISDPFAYYELMMATMTINLCSALKRLEDYGVAPKELVLVGGLAKSEWWRTLVATLSNCQCKTLSDPGMGSGQGGLVYLTWLLLHSKGYNFSPEQVSQYMVSYSAKIDHPSQEMLLAYSPLAKRYEAELRAALSMSNHG